MILIWDNGESYSSHSIHFIETGPFTLADAEALIDARQNENYSCRDGKIIGTAEHLDWREAGGSEPLAAFIFWPDTSNETILQLSEPGFAAAIAAMKARVEGWREHVTTDHGREAIRELEIKIETLCAHRPGGAA